jgi:hypothetical protein
LPEEQIGGSRAIEITTDVSIEPDHADTPAGNSSFSTSSSLSEASPSPLC